MRFRNTHLTWALTAVLTVSVLAACGDDDDDEDAGSAQGPALTGAPIELGYINVENSPAGSYVEYRQGAEAAVRYVNQSAGGINGRPLALENCVSDGSGESSIACANRFVQSGKVAVVPGVDFGGDGSTPVLAQAGIPLVGGLPVQSAQLTSSNAFSFIGASPGAAAAMARYAGETLKAKKVSVLYVDIPAAQLAFENFVKPVLEKLGATTVTGIGESATAADYTPALTKANEGEPDAIIMLFGGQSCSKIMQAGMTLGISTERTIYGHTCASDTQLEAGGAGAEGARFNSPFLPASTDDPDVELFRTAMGEYAPDAGVGPDAQTGFNSIMNVATLMRRIDGDITPATLTAALKATSNEPNFMAKPYTCNGAVVQGLPAMCNAGDRIVEYKNGQFVDLSKDWVSGFDILAG